MEDSEEQVEDNGIKRMENVLKRKKCYFSPIVTTDILSSLSKSRPATDFRLWVGLRPLASLNHITGLSAHFFTSYISSSRRL